MTHTKLVAGHSVTEDNCVEMDFHFEPTFADCEPDLSRLGPDQRRAYRFALQILQNTKAELMEIVDKLENEAGRAFLNDFGETVEQHKADAAMLESAHVRLMTAAAAYAVCQGKTASEPPPS